MAAHIDGDRVPTGGAEVSRSGSPRVPGLPAAVEEHNGRVRRVTEGVRGEHDIARLDAEVRP